MLPSWQVLGSAEVDEDAQATFFKKGYVLHILACMFSEWQIHHGVCYLRSCFDVCDYCFFVLSLPTLFASTRGMFARLNQS